MMRIILLLIFSLSLSACVMPRPLLIEPENALRPAKVADIQDDLDFKGLEKSLEDHIEDYRRRPMAYPEHMRFGPTLVATSVYMSALSELREVLKQGSGPARSFLREKFSCYEVAGDGKWGQAFITSYFDPLIAASRQPTESLFRPIYLVPQDMVLIRLDDFRQRFPHWSIFSDSVTEQKSASALIRGRLYQKGNAKFISPYFSRYELDSLGLLRGRGLELAYADPIDVFMTQIQGSGTLLFADGHKLRIGYAAQNGWPYVAIGKFLKSKIEPGEISLHSIERTLRSMPPDEVQEILNQNPSYVFFEILKSEPRTTLGTIARSGRTIATDRRYFPKGALGYVQFEKPIFDASDSETPSSWQKVGRLVMDQDTGGAIRGTGRLDLYWGHGALAKQSAGVMKQWGQLCYLVPR